MLKRKILSLWKVMPLIFLLSLCGFTAGPAYAANASSTDILVQCSSSGVVTNNTVISSVYLPIQSDTSGNYYLTSVDAAVYTGNTLVKELDGFTSINLHIGLGSVTNYDYNATTPIVYDIKYRGHYGVIGEGAQEITEDWQSAGLYFVVVPTSPAVTTGTISGTVRTSGGNPISGATVSASVYSATTASDGTYTILNVPAGAGYTVTASKTGYLDVTAANVTVTAGNTTIGVDFSLNSAGGGNSSISSNTATFDKNSANTSTGHYADIPVTVTFNGNTLLSIANGSIPLIENTDYTVSGSVYSISKTYLAIQSIGTTTLAFNFSAGSPQSLAVTVIDSTPQNPTYTIITGVAALPDISVANGTALADARSQLPATVTASVYGGGTVSAAVSWSADSTPSYDGSTTGSYAFTGTLTGLPANVTNTNSMTAVVRVKVTSATTYTVSVSAVPAGNGTVSGGGTYAKESQVTVTATPNSGYTFVNWTEGGAEVSTNADYSFTMDTVDRTLVANFVQANSSGGGGGGGGNTTLPAPDAKEEIEADQGGSVSSDDVTVEIPAGALLDDATISIDKLNRSEANKTVPEGLRIKMAGDVYEITTDGRRDFGDNTISIKIAYDPEQVTEGEFPAVHYYDETLGRWIKLVTELVQEDGRWYAVTRVNHLTRFTVFSVTAEPEEEPAVEKQTIILTIGRIQASVDGSPYTLDAPPYVDKQARRTLVPIRFVSEALGANVKWDSATRQVTIEDSGRVIALTPGSLNVLVDGTAQTIDCAPAVLPPGRTFVPLRFVSETLGAQVNYNNVTKQITFTR